MKVLFERLELEVNEEGRYENTALRIAIKRGNEGIIRALLEREDIKVQRTYEWRYTVTPRCLLPRGQYGKAVP